MAATIFVDMRATMCWKAAMGMTLSGATNPARLPRLAIITRRLLMDSGELLDQQFDEGS